MKFLDRFIVLLSALLLSVLSLMTFSNCVGGFICVAGDWLYDFLTSTWYATFMLQVLSIVLIACLIEMTFRSGKGMGRLLKRTTESGDIFVSVSTIEAFARNLATEIEGVQDVSLTAKPGREGLDITLRVTASKGAILPEMTSKLESRIKEALPAQSGFPVKSVTTYIKSAV
jgi:hypothetical protein